MMSESHYPFFISSPHAGEQVPEVVSWLQALEEPTLMRDVDRYVDQLYGPIINQLGITLVMTPWHRYVVDLNRKPHEFDQTSVEGAPLPKGKHPKGLHWSVTTHGETLIPEPMPMALHEELLEKYYQPFHNRVLEVRKSLREHGEAHHLDIHSMPSKGTSLHPDPGEDRAEVVISDFNGKSSGTAFRDIVMESYQKAGFQVAYNWPYVGGGITQIYGDPEAGFHNIQVELNRKLYMDEGTKKIIQPQFEKTQKQISQAVEMIYNHFK